MCGIIGYAGNKNPMPILIGGLKRLEYRGYDSAGIAILNAKKFYVQKSVGKIEQLVKKISYRQNIEGGVGIGHTRWATHGKPTLTNAHPHNSCDNKIWVAHNGIIENYKDIKNQLIAKGHKFKSETDTEVIPHLIEEYSKKGFDFKKSVRLAMSDIKGTYALTIINSDEPDKLIAVKNSSPLLIGITKNGQYFAASDATALLTHTREIIYLNDKEMAVLNGTGYQIETISGQSINKKIEVLKEKEESIQKSGFPHFMLKEIFEEPEAVENAINGRLIYKEGTAKLGGIETIKNELSKINHLTITACGTAYLAGQIGEYLVEELSGVSSKVEYASEFRYKNPVIKNNSAILAVSQSGETADTLAALYEAERKNCLTLGIVNVVGSSIARQTHAGIYNHAGPEIGVASTKVFVSQLSVLILLALFLGRQRNLSLTEGKKIIMELSSLPKKMRQILKQAPLIKKMARKYSKFDNFLYLGRKYNMPIAYEGALKLKEISYVHAEGYGAGEMKHGPIAMINKNFPSVAIATTNSVYEKMESNIEEIKARNGRVLAIATKGNKKITKLADDVIYIPKTLEPLEPILTVLPLHLFAYYFGVLRGFDVDKPRNLAKSVTVE
ncbi:MAG: glutamine--fructose-6-phosphate transaminase (isomerizing) [Candidatus Yanofskybacteria bacterium CG10_big_fil_rev_8_21_14_0_10_36_16]|uniref:Glutamine--fructose-6-phosphate aminotransferase [isomerizing] n=1 Tax=Candidatus Yanofskybacteria bacterium CG10_big_fil_rev_8_21_14_0_10_36_16 TaxID=1975096 RepID=A0A2J0Q6R5_9BACT|nr:MAG: glutamine--fructose-6-phosphate transaminase (isomerizing) [Candidatus Yanofskybacteria bacterium CG10_big_fil_rev_8_21_14_0_10_36_16]